MVLASHWLRASHLSLVFFLAPFKCYCVTQIQRSTGVSLMFSTMLGNGGRHSNRRINASIKGKHNIFYAFIRSLYCFLITMIFVFAFQCKRPLNGVVKQPPITSSFQQSVVIQIQSIASKVNSASEGKGVTKVRKLRRSWTDF